ncbi:cobyric acid synthase [Ideonella sp. BN130291]|uniref:cobyric acid synthase n=1 Tax=Ideonella sp. BN130291 TaxID=3112940 RepID=UPI002E25AA56|nr:cobyric acid synthase [Ideonella sp. BN130291]
MSARCIMVLGTTSGAGKSYLATGLCRWYAKAGFRVAPFKAQNMSNNARVVALPDGDAGEIGSAQYFQALAARAVPDVRMNPVLLKPEADTRSQVVVCGRVRADLGAMPWHQRSALLWPHAEQALAELRASHEVVVIEGAGSPAEINLAASDFVNTRTAIAAQAACLLVTDIDRGGAFAHLYGTHALMDARVRKQLRGFVLNKFRGDERLLAPAPEQLQALTGVPTLAVLPMDRAHGLPEEDGVFDETMRPAAPGELRIGVIAPPHISNLDEFQPLRQLPGVHLRWVRDAAAAQSADWLILPGSKHTRADLAWLRAHALDAAIAAHVQAGRPLLAICGGLQMLGHEVLDAHGYEGASPGRSAGLGLLPLRTEFAASKRLRHTHARFGALTGPWAALSGVDVQGYEIRAGHTTACAPCDAALPHGLGWQRGPVLALYLHGLFENPSVQQALFGTHTAAWDDGFDRLAQQLEQRFTHQGLMQLL